MTEKEKAKSYDKAIERAKKLYGNGIIEEIFPELKESKDKRIREAILNGLIDCRDAPDLGWSNFGGIHINDCIAWLENQGDKDKLIQELGEYKVKYTQEVLEKYINNMSNKDDERLRKTTIAFLKDFAEQGYENAVECIDWIEKQGEQKPQGKSALEAIKEENVDNANKVEPKFKVGEWIASNLSNSSNLLRIIGIDETNYEVVTPQGSTGVPSIRYIDKHFHLWTIEDVRDGNVLVCDIDKAEIGGDVEKLPNIVSTIFIFKKLINSRDYIHSYCHLYDKRFLGLQRTMYYNSFVYNISPATKEQRDLLFKKIKEAGYGWDTEKKELKKKKVK